MFKTIISFALLLTMSIPLGNSNNANAVKVVSNTTLDNNDVFTQKYYQQYIKSDREKQHECLAKNIYFEARNEPFAGQFAVALVTLNRVHDTAFPNTICEVVYQGIHHADGFPKRDRCQFSWYCDGNSDEVRNKRAWEVVQKTANLAMLQYSSIKAEGLDYTEGARFYHTFEVNPRWSKVYPKVGRIGDHIFYR
tara:strand:+ start:723 stop:1304 length:582 start_codon:yes stop_codon:yes gene_type:complete